MMEIEIDEGNRDRGRKQRQRKEEEIDEGNRERGMKQRQMREYRQKRTER